MKTRSLPPALLAAMLIVACGGADEPRRAQSKEPVTVLRITDDSKPGKWSFDRKELRARAGRIKLIFSNPSDLGHNVRIQTGAKCCFQPGSKDVGGTPVIGGLASDAGKTATAELDLKPGNYWFLCANAGHWQAGQRGTLIVKG